MAIRHDPIDEAADDAKHALVIALEDGRRQSEAIAERATRLFHAGMPLPLARRFAAADHTGTMLTVSLDKSIILRRPIDADPLPPHNTPLYRFVDVVVDRSKK
jgi:hypothetical protein